MNRKTFREEKENKKMENKDIEPQINISFDKYREFIELKTKMEIVIRFFGKAAYISLEDFNAITGYNIDKKEPEITFEWQPIIDYQKNGVANGKSETQTPELVTKKEDIK